MKYDAETMPDFRVGEVLTADKLNAILRALRVNPSGIQGYREEGISAEATKVRTAMRWLQVQAIEAIAPYSVFGACYQSDLPSGALFSVQKIGTAANDNYGSPLALFTNGDISLESDTIGWARPIGYYDSTTLIVTGTAPTIGMPCGVILDTFGVGSEGTGFVCLAIDDDGNAVVVRTREPIAVAVEVVSDIDPFNGTSGECAIGAGHVFYRDPVSDVLDFAPDPGALDSEMEVQLVNLDESPVKAGAHVIASDVLGVGLVIHPPGQKPWEWAYLNEELTYNSSSSATICSQSTSNGSLTADGATKTVWCPAIPENWKAPAPQYVQIEILMSSGMWNVRFFSECLIPDPPPE